MSITDSIYKKLPVLAQHMAISGFGFYWRYLRFGPGYTRFVQEYLTREHYTARDWAAWQTGQLSRILRIAVLNVPYYREVWNSSEKAGADSGRLYDLPLLEKEPLRKNPDQFLRDDVHPLGLLHFYTSGSSGTPITSYYTIMELRQSLALRETRSAGWAGVSFKMPRATFSGRMVEPNPASKGPYYRYNLAERQVYLSPFHLKPKTARFYLESLERHNIQWLTGYAVSYYLLGKIILEQELAVPPLKAIITTSEKVTPEMRAVMELAYGCRVFEEYSTVENALFASECEHGRLHVSPDVALVEILRPDGDPCEPGEVGEVVTTTLAKTFQPLIRFRLGDLAAWDQEPCPCGRQMPVIKEVVGRMEDVVIGPDGQQMVRFHGIFVNQPHIREGQIVQETLQHIRVRVAPVEGFNQHDQEDIVRRVQQRLGCEVAVTVEQVDEIPRTKAGKYKAVISNLRTGELP